MATQPECPRWRINCATRATVPDRGRLYGGTVVGGDIGYVRNHFDLSGKVVTFIGYNGIVVAGVMIRDVTGRNIYYQLPDCAGESRCSLESIADVYVHYENDGRWSYSTVHFGLWGDKENPRRPTPTPSPRSRVRSTKRATTSSHEDEGRTAKAKGERRPPPTRLCRDIIAATISDDKESTLVATGNRQLVSAEIGMSPGMLAKLRQLADEADPPTNVSALVRLAVEDYLTFIGEWDESMRPANEARLARHMPSTRETNRAIES